MQKILDLGASLSASVLDWHVRAPIHHSLGLLSPQQIPHLGARSHERWSDGNQIGDHEDSCDQCSDEPDWDDGHGISTGIAGEGRPRCLADHQSGRDSDEMPTSASVVACQLTRTLLRR